MIRTRTGARRPYEPPPAERTNALATPYCTNVGKPDDAPPLGHPGRKAKADHLAELMRDGYHLPRAATVVRLRPDAAAEVLRSEGYGFLLPVDRQTVGERCEALMEALGAGQLTLFRDAA